jgi:hypothetical protein
LDTLIETFRGLLTVLLVAMGLSVVLASIGLVALARSIRRLRIPPEADFFTTMRYIFGANHLDCLRSHGPAQSAQQGHGRSADSFH